MYDAEVNRTDEQLRELMTEISSDLMNVIESHADDTEAALSVSALMLRYSVGLLRGNLTDAESVHTLLHTIQNIETYSPVLPNHRKIN